MSDRLDAVIVDESFVSSGLYYLSSGFSLLLQLHHVKGRGRGLLVGAKRESEAIVVGYCAEGTRDPDKRTCISSACDLFVRQHYPAGCGVIGWWVWNTEPRLTNKQVLAIGGSHASCGTSSVVMVLSNNEEVKCFKCCADELVEVRVTREDVRMLVTKELVCLRLCTAVDLCQALDGECLL